MWLLGLSVLLCGTLFEDIHQRFYLDLPANWQYTPPPGDDLGVYFRKEEDQSIAQLGIRIFPFQQPLGLDDLVQVAAKAAESQPNYRLLEAAKLMVAHHETMKRRYVVAVTSSKPDPQKPWEGKTNKTKMVQEYILLDDKVGYVLHAEALVEDFDGFEKDFDHIVKSFSLGAVDKKRSKKHAKKSIGSLPQQQYANPIPSPKDFATQSNTAIIVDPNR